MNKRYALAGLLVLTGLWLGGCGDEPGGNHASIAEGPVLENPVLASVQTVSVPSSRLLPGMVQSRSSIQMAPRVMAQVEKIHVREGNTVQEGELLLELDDREFQSKVGQAESALGRARAESGLASATLERYKGLLEGRAVSQQEYDVVLARERAARQGVGQAEAALSEARTYLSFSRIHSPADGIVVSRHVDPGALAAPGMPLLTIEENRYRVEVPVDSALSDAVSRGKKIFVEVEPAGYAGDVEIKEVIPAVDPMSRTFLVRADLPRTPGLRSGQYARVSINRGTRDVLRIPRGALVKRGQMDGVYLVAEDGRVRFRIVETGSGLKDDGIEVLAGLNAGDRLIGSNTAQVREGALVKQEQRQ